jgi:hypothetical protein
MRITMLSVGLTAALVLGGLTVSPAGHSSIPRTQDSRATLVEFQARVHRYVVLHRQLEASGPAIPISRDWAEITAAIDALAARIVAARSGAQRGNVFTPAIEQWFRQSLAECLEGVDTEAFLAGLEEEEAKDFVLIPRVHGRWPAEAPLTSMPAHLLAVLRPLPDELQYRFMGHHLILWDVHANIIVDFIVDALPPSESTGAGSSWSGHPE